MWVCSLCAKRGYAWIPGWPEDWKMTGMSNFLLVSFFSPLLSLSSKWHFLSPLQLITNQLDVSRKDMCDFWVISLKINLLDLDTLLPFFPWYWMENGEKWDNPENWIWGMTELALLDWVTSKWLCERVGNLSLIQATIFWSCLEVLC